MEKYNGHSSYNAWNVSLWINNDEGLYNTAKDMISYSDNHKEAAKMMLEHLADCGITHTPDGAPYSVTTIRAAMRGM